MSPADGILLYGGCAGDTNSIDQICMSRDGETWKTAYAENWSRETDAGDGVRWFTKEFIPKGSTEKQVIITGRKRDYLIQNLELITTMACAMLILILCLPQEGIKLKYGYAMKYPKQKRETSLNLFLVTTK